MASPAARPLLVGLVHAGQQPAAGLPAIHRLLASAYAAGMRAGRHPVALADVHRGYLGSLAIRVPFTALPWGDPGGVPPEAIAERAALIRFVLATAGDLRWSLQEGLRNRGSGPPAPKVSRPARNQS